MCRLAQTLGVMKKVHLELAGEDDKVDIVDVLASFMEDEIELIRQYSTQTARVRTCTLLKRGMTGFQGLTIDHNGLSIQAGTCSLPELYELLHVLRPITLQKERASFAKIVKVLDDRLREPQILTFLQVNQHAFKHGQMSLFFQIKIADRPLFDESLLRTWLNGTQYHTDANKAADWAALEATLGEPNAQAVVMSQLHAKVVAILNIDYIAKQVLTAPEHDA